MSSRRNSDSKNRGAYIFYIMSNPHFKKRLLIKRSDGFTCNIRDFVSKNYIFNYIHVFKIVLKYALFKKSSSAYWYPLLSKGLLSHGRLHH